MTDDFWADRFRWCALAAGFLAASDGRLQDREDVKQLAYEFYAEGVFSDRVPSRKSAS